MRRCPNCGQENPEDARFCNACATPLEAAPVPPREVRKTVTVLFTDVTGSTSLGERLDPESLRRVMSRYFEEVRIVLERHGGRVEKFIGDAVMAVFGIPVLHEDDALRAVRAAWDMRDALSRLNDLLRQELGVTIETRTGVNTGEVVAGDASVGHALVTGDAVNVAARLEQAATPREILIGPDTYRLVRDAVEIEPTEPLALKGKSEAVAAYRLLGVRPDTPGTARHLEAPMVGRDRELSLLQWAFERAVDERTCHLATILGAAGVGKSRLVEEFLRSLSDRATVLRGRCLPYGEGITFWAVLEAIHQAAGISDRDDPDSARSKVASLVEGEEQADRIAERVAQVMGLVADHAVPEETLWAIRKLVESIARRRPLLLVFDDIHWAEPTFLDLMEHIADWSRAAPILLLCLGRHELLDLRPAWGGGKMNATTISLEPLSEVQIEELVHNLLGRAQLPAEASRRIADAAEGNPLFVEEMVAMLIDDGLLRRDDDHWMPTGDLSTLSVPPTIQALLAARLDRLANEERQVIERASVVGRTFYRGAVTELAPEHLKPDVAAQLLALVRRELIRPQPSDFVGEDTYRFRHILIRDSAYEAMPKEVRADLHERFAAWLEAAAGERVREYEEILAYHLEQAYRYRTDLGLSSQRVADVGARAGRLLASAGLRAAARGDSRGSTKMLSRAAELLPPDDYERTELLAPLARSLLDLAEFEASERAGLELAAIGKRTRDRRASIQAEQLLIAHRTLTDPQASLKDLAAEQQRLLEEATALGDRDVLFETHLWSSTFLVWRGRCGRAQDLIEAAWKELPPDDYSAFRAERNMMSSTTEGPFPVDRGIELWTSILEARRGTVAEPWAKEALGWFLAMAGRTEEGLKLEHETYQSFEDFGLLWPWLAPHRNARTLLVGRRPDLAEQRLRPGLDRLRAMGSAYAPTSAYLLAQALLDQGRDAEAEEFAALGREGAQADDIDAEYGWRMVLARIKARKGDIEEAERLAREAVQIMEPTDLLYDRGMARMSLAEALRAGGRLEEAAEAARAAHAEYKLKEATVLVERVDRFLADLGPSAS